MARRFGPCVRRRPVLGALAGVLVASGPATASDSRATTDGGKPQFQGDPANTGHCPTECPPTANVEQAWEIETLSMTTITLTAAGDAIYGVGENTGVVENVDPTSGSIRWRRELDDRLRSDGDRLTCPGLVDDTLYLGAGETWDDGRDVPHGVVYALDAADGSTRWRVGVGRGPAFVTPDGETVFAGTRGGLYALDVDDGSSRWDDVPDDPDATVAFPAVADGSVYYATDSGRVYAVDAADGERRWVTDAGAGTPPSVADGRVYVGEGEGGTAVRALDAADGTQAWTFDAPGPVTHPPTVADGRAFAFVREETDDRYDDGVLTALDASTGESLWRFETPGVYVGPLAPLVAGDSVVVVGNPQDSEYDNAAYVVDAASGTLETQVDMHVDVGAAPPVVLNDTLVVGDNSAGRGFLSAYTGDCGGSGGDEETHAITIAANGPTEYTLGVDGSLEPETDGGRFAAESSDEPTAGADGVRTVSDVTGPAPDNADGESYYGDRFRFSGALVTLELNPRDDGTDVRLSIDGERVSAADARQFGG